MNIFFTPNISGNTYTLDEAESKHCIRVLRHQKGDGLFLVDGRGGWYQTIIIDANPKKCIVEIESKIEQFEKRAYKLHVAIAPTKNIDRLEWFLEKATEIGVDEITPLLCEHSERKQIKTDRLEKVIVSAMKQSLKAYLPKLNNLTNFETFINNCNEQQKFIAHCQQGDKVLLFNSLQKNKSVVLLIGPEGDFSISEVEMATAAGFKAVTLGNSRLRTETAGIVAVQTVNVVNEI
ncbi:MAG TPA: 16S rRNA (uracil(1498)-N(3))-methyltransferase [Prolixibacteraceae bacterium]|nr:16S rRNA (uracil(1498)-N(3))-methyltransferase [Prolixibacteraceae bacterium]